MNGVRIISVVAEINVTPLLEIIIIIIYLFIIMNCVLPLSGKYFIILFRNYYFLLLKHL